MKRIVHVCRQDPCYKTGGQGVTVENQAREQLALGYEVYWLSCRIKGFKEEEEIDYGGRKLKVLRFSSLDSYEISTPYEGSEMRQCFRLRDFRKRVTPFIKDNFSPDDTFVHLHGFYAVPLMAQNLQEYNTCSQYHLLVTKRMERLQIRKENSFVYGVIRELERKSFRVSKKIIVPSTGAGQEIKDIYPQASQKIFVVPGGIESRYLNPPFYSKAKNFTVLAWGRISPEKNFESVMGTAKEMPEIGFIIFGRTDDTEGDRGQYHQKLLALSQGFKNLQFIARPEGITGEEKLKLIDAADVVVVPSLYETFGLVIIEAMARGKPIITSPAYGACDIMKIKRVERPEINEYGIVCPPSAQEIGRAIELLFQNRNLRKRMAKNCQKRAQDFLWPGIVSKLMEIYRR